MKTYSTISASALLMLLTTDLPAQSVGGSAKPDSRADQQEGRRPPNPKPIRQITTGQPNAWFDRTKLFMGEFLDKERVEGLFSFKNPTGNAISFKNLQGSCQCAQATIKVGGRVYELTKKTVSNSLHRIDT